MTEQDRPKHVADENADENANTNAGENAVEDREIQAPAEDAAATTALDTAGGAM